VLCYSTLPLLLVLKPWERLALETVFFFLAPLYSPCLKSLDNCGAFRLRMRSIPGPYWHSCREGNSNPRPDAFEHCKCLSLRPRDHQYLLRHSELYRSIIFLTPRSCHTTISCCDRVCVCVWQHFVSASLHECWIEVMEMACPSQFVRRLDYAVVTVLPWEWCSQ
jgi:phosphatidylserine decarboxylase